MLKTIAAPISLAVLLVGLAGQALAATNFSGEWKLDPAKSDYGPIPAPEVMTRSITHKDPVLQSKTYQKGAAGEVTTELKYTTDGKECINKTPQGDVKGKAKFVDGKLVIEGNREVQGTPITFKEIWNLAADGKELVINSHIAAQGQEFEIKLVFVKQ